MKRLTDDEKIQLSDLYWCDNLTLPEIADRFGVSYPAIRQWFIKLGIPRRDNSEAQLLSNGTQELTPGLLRDLYIGQHLSQHQIAHKLGRSQTGIGHLLRRYNIPIRGKANPGPSNGRYKHGEYVNERIYRDMIDKDRCAICGATEQLCIHHKNLDHSDNRLENLEIMCHSCHSSLHKTLYWQSAS